jgi:Sec-independent protein translocase protein TatA
MGRGGTAEGLPARAQPGEHGRGGAGTGPLLFLNARPWEGDAAHCTTSEKPGDSAALRTAARSRSAVQAHPSQFTIDKPRQLAYFLIIMPLTLNQFLFLIITLAVVVVVTVLVILALQLKKTAAEAEKTLAEYRELAKDLQVLDQAIKDRLDELGHTLQAARQVSRMAVRFSSKVIQPVSKWWPVFSPVVRFVWRQWKKRKEERNV